MTSISLSAIVTELSREGTRHAYVLISDTEQKAAEMYAVVKDKIVEQDVPYHILDLSQKVGSLPYPQSFSRTGFGIILLENTAASSDESRELNDYVKNVADHASNSILWYLSIYTLGLRSSNYSSRAISAFTIITKVIPDA